jgi:hypothetical protein
LLDLFAHEMQHIAQLAPEFRARSHRQLTRAGHADAESELGTRRDAGRQRRSPR